MATPNAPAAVGILASSFGTDAIAIAEMLASAFISGTGSATLQPVSFAVLGKTVTVNGSLNATAS